MADTAPATVLGSTFRAYRASGTVVGISSGTNPLPNNFFDNLSYCSPDMSWNPGVANAVGISVEGTYLANIRYMINSIPGGAKLNGAMGLNRAGTITYEVSVGSFCDSSFGANSPNIIGGALLMYLRAGDLVFPATWAGGSYGSALQGESTGGWTVFALSLLNRSLA